MGQSSSSQQHQQQWQEGRGNNVGSLERNSGGGHGGRQGNESVPGTSHLRRSRRIRESLSQLGGRLVSSSISSITSGGAASNSASPSGRSSSLRIRSRVRLSSNRSPLTSATSGPRSSRNLFSLSRPIARNTQSSPADVTTHSPISGQDAFMGAADDLMDISPVTPAEPPRPEPPPNSNNNNNSNNSNSNNSNSSSNNNTNNSTNNNNISPASSPRRSRMSRGRPSISTTLTSLLAELNAARSSTSSSRRNSQILRPSSSFLDFDSDIDGDMEIDTSSSGNTTSTGSASRNERPELSSFGDPSLGDSSENPARARPGEDQAAMLSRLLSVAAAMTAASLVGSSEQAFTEAQDVAGDSGDNSFQSFLHALQTGRLAAALRNGGNEMGGGIPADSADASTAPLNFFRMFRFGASPATAADIEPSEAPPVRMVPVIIVGIRSVTPRDNTNQNNNGTPTPPFFDALANLPVTPPPPPSMGASRGAGGRSRLMSSQRRASVGAAGGDGSRSQRRGSRPASEILFPSASRAPDTPQGSHAPPSTPADLSIPLFSSGTMPRRSSGDATHSPEQASRGASDRETFRSRRHSTPPVSSSDEPSSSGPAGGSSRSNIAGGSSSSNTPNNHRRQEGTRSWIIYVLGGSYPENHPILTTPSLFTDTPTYEDMMLLSSLLGPAKPPVASQEDVNSAGGIFTVGDTDCVGENGTIRQLQEGDRCLVCLCDFEKGEQCRSLVQCQHIFHRECIDEWLTTGRNSCPLCRAQGVQEKDKAPRSSDQSTQPSAAVNIT